MGGIYLILCLAIIVFVAFVALVIVILKSDERGEPHSSPAPARVVVNVAKDPTPQHHRQNTAVADYLPTVEQKE